MILSCLIPLFFTGRGDHPRDARTVASSLQSVDSAAGPVRSRTWVMMTTTTDKQSGVQDAKFAFAVSSHTAINKFGGLWLRVRASFGIRVGKLLGSNYNPTLRLHRNVSIHILHVIIKNHKTPERWKLFS